MTTSTLPQQPTESPVADLFLAALTACLAPEVHTTEQDRISTIDLLCSGWQPAG